MKEYVMKYFAILIFSLIFAVDQAQCDNKINWSSLVEREGVLYEKFTNKPFSGIVKGEEQGEVINGLKHGEWLSFWDSGQLSSKKNYKSGEMDGPQILWDDNGKIWGEWFMMLGEPHGVFKNYDDGILISEFNYIVGVKDGVQKSFYKTGQIADEKFYRKGLKVGRHRSWEETGGLSIEKNYEGNELHGVTKTYSNGSLLKSANYLYGKKNGFEKYFDVETAKIRSAKCWVGGVEANLGQCK